MTAGPCPSRCWRKHLPRLREKFGAASWETQTVRGAWQYRGEVYLDNLTRFFVDVPDLPEHRAFFQRL